MRAPLPEAGLNGVIYLVKCSYIWVLSFSKIEITLEYEGFQ